MQRHGGAREHFALAVHLGEEGLLGHRFISQYGGDVNPVEVLHIQHCFMASFEAPEFLQRPDRELYSKLGRHFPNSRLVPLFREYRPYYYPWFLTPGQVKFLTLVLAQAREVAQRARRNGNLLRRGGSSRILVRQAEKVSGQLQWKDAIHNLPQTSGMKFTPAWIRAPISGIPDELGAQLMGQFDHLRKDGPAPYGTWEVDLMPNLEFVQDGPRRPYFPLIALCVDPATNYVLTHWTGHENEVGQKFPAHVVTYMENRQWVPAQISVISEAMQHILRPLAVALNIELVLAPHLPTLEAVFRDFRDTFKGPQF